MFKSKRVKTNEVLNTIWEFRAEVWDQPRVDERGERFWACNVEGVRGSRAMGIFINELRGLRRLRREVLIPEAVGDYEEGAEMEERRLG